MNNEKIYIIEIPSNSKIIYIPDKIEIDDNSKELSLIATKNLYINTDIIENENTLTLNKYTKKQEKDFENDIIITTELNIKSTITFNLVNIAGEINE